jgi:hypothetical protein
MLSFFQMCEVLENYIGYTIYCDLDGVLVDLERGVREKLGMGRPMSRLEMMRALARMRRNSDEELVEFFANLPWTEDGERLWTYLAPYEPLILTGGAEEANGIGAGKNKWVQKNLGISASKIIHESNKSKFAGPNKILIDDYDKSARDFASAGGIGILHTNTGNTISQLKNIIVGQIKPNLSVRGQS